MSGTWVHWFFAINEHREEIEEEIREEIEEDKGVTKCDTLGGTQSTGLIQ